MRPSFIIVDWANNAIFGLKTFKTFEDAWEYVYINIDDEETYQDIYAVSYKEFQKYYL